MFDSGYENCPEFGLTTASDKQSYYTSNERQLVNNASHGQSSSVTEHINVDGVSCLRKSFESYILS